MTALANVLAVSTVCAFLAVLAFIIIYARVPWYASALGRSIMAAAVAIGLLTVVGLARRIDNRLDGIDLERPIIIATILGYLIVTAAYVFTTSVVLSSARQAAQETDPDTDPDTERKE